MLEVIEDNGTFRLMNGKNVVKEFDNIEAAQQSLADRIRKNAVADAILTIAECAASQKDSGFADKVGNIVYLAVCKDNYSDYKGKEKTPRARVNSLTTMNEATFAPIVQRTLKLASAGKVLADNPDMEIDAKDSSGRTHTVSSYLAEFGETMLGSTDKSARKSDLVSGAASAARTLRE